MANLSENPQWVDGIYQIETSDPVVGGPDGVSNRQAKELASRTRYLKKEQEKTGSDLAIHAAAADPHTQYAPKANPTFTGTPKAPTPATDSNSQQVATTAFVKSVTTALVNGAPAALDTLQELAKAVGNDPNFSATVLNELAKKLSLSGGTLTGEVLLSASNALRLIYGDYGVIMRNDGNRFYLLLTNKGDKTGGYNALRPFDINLATGDMTVGHDLNVGGLLKEKGQRVYSPNNKPTAADVGALTIGGTAVAAAKLATARTINGVAFDGTTNIALTPANIGALPAAGTAVAASKLAVARKIAGVAFDGSADIDINSQSIFATSLSIGNAVDLNTYTAVGLYHQAANAQAVSGKNYPEAQAGSLEVLKHAGITQIYRIYNNSRCYKRTQYSGVWSAWILDYDTANKPTAADIGALPAGGTAVAASKLGIARTINGVAFDGTANIALTPANIGALPAAGTAVAATKLATPRKINGVAFDGSADINLSNDLPVGPPIPYPLPIPPAGWIKCNGQAFNKSLYPVLASCYPSGVLPDLRSEFIRGWDDGRGVDVGRGVLSSQGDAIRNITGSLFYGCDADAKVPTSNTSTGATYYDTSAKIPDTENYLSVVQSPTDMHWYPSKLDASRIVPTASENRPRNIAFNYIVRAA